MSILPPACHVRSLHDAYGLAMALGDEYAYLDAGLVFDHNGRLITHAIFSEIPGSLTTALDWIQQSADLAACARATLVVSVRDRISLRESDLARYRHFTASLSASGIILSDWIITDGDDSLSVSWLLTGGDSWGARRREA